MNLERKQAVSVSLVAKKAGVSPATVSRVLHGGGSVSQEKRERVKAVLDSLNGMPRMRRIRAKSLSHGTVAVLFIKPHDVLYSSSIDLHRTILAAEEVLRAQKLNMIFGVVDDEGGIPEAVAAGRVDGLLLAGVDYPPRLKSILDRFPSVWLSSHHEGNSALALAGNEEIGRLAAEYLLKRGHRSLAYFQIPESHPVHSSRGEFFEFTAKRAGAEVHRYRSDASGIKGDDCQDWEVLYTNVLKLAKSLRKTRPIPTGVFIPVGMLTGLAYRAFAACGMCPGKDIEVVCCEQNMPLLTSLDPRPAFIQIDAPLIARCAVEELLRRIADPQGKLARIRISVAPHLHEGSNGKGE